METARAFLRSASGMLWVLPFDNRPGKLFEGLQHCRAVIFISRQASSRRQTRVFTTRYQRWPTRETRKSLFQQFEFTESNQAMVFPGHFAKIASVQERSAFSKVLARSDTPSTRQTSPPPRTGMFVFYQEATQYWVKATGRIAVLCKKWQSGRTGSRPLSIPGKSGSLPILDGVDKVVFFTPILSLTEIASISVTL